MFNKMKIRFKTEKVAEIYEERRPYIKIGRQFRDGTNSITGGRQWPLIVMMVGWIRGYFWKLLGD